MIEKKTAVVDQLANSRKTLFSTLNKLDEAAWNMAVYSPEVNGYWTIVDIVRHLLTAERGMTFLMQKILKDGVGVPDDFDRERYNISQVTKLKEIPPKRLLPEMEKNRVVLLKFIDSLQEEDWLKSGRHGSGKILSIEEICLTIAHHELVHHSEISEKITN